MELKPDLRRPDPADRATRCRRCGARIIVLPNDRRQGYCFECYDPLEVSSAPWSP